jgi:hypothetical protein
MDSRLQLLRVGYRVRCNGSFNYFAYEVGKYYSIIEIKREFIVVSSELSNDFYFWYNKDFKGTSDWYFWDYFSDIRLERKEKLERIMKNE